MEDLLFFNRDISWLSFNGRVLGEAARENVPLLERINFLSIFSSNLDEFYRVRIPALLALNKIQKDNSSVYDEAVDIIDIQQKHFGGILIDSIIPSLRQHNIFLLYKDPVPEKLLPDVSNYFFTAIAGFMSPVLLEEGTAFFPANNQLYIAVTVRNKKQAEQLYLVNVPVNEVPRFYKATQPEGDYIIFLEDIIILHLQQLFPAAEINGAYPIKITRDAELELQDEYAEDLADKIEKQLAKRDFGFASRFLYSPGLPLRLQQTIIHLFNLHKASIVEGGLHHNLKDLSSIPVRNAELSYPPWPALQDNKLPGENLFDSILKKDRAVHAPYQSYDTILRFFNEAAIDPSVEEIYTTMYRIAKDSRIAFALISAVKNGKKVSVLVELKARFDEANNIHWAKEMKAAGVKISYSSNALKVHAKIALVIRKDKKEPYIGLLATGNLNETTARFYTDHILLTAHQPMLAEMQKLFSFLAKRKKVDKEDAIDFRHLLVAQFNLQSRFLELIDREINFAEQGLPAEIMIKMNNLEEEVMISKLYEASNAGVKINLVVRSICRLVPGIKGQSENIVIKRIVDRYLEHGRVFVFGNNGRPEVFMGSADWMNRNIYRRIEVCFPVYDENIREQLRHILDLQWRDNVQAVYINKELDNKPVMNEDAAVRSQEAIREYLRTLINE
ncbi:polyphosphate kinase 1 [Ferruginibacter sp. HRS2-29]|uniref:polyphosphate kinase 1 n=1 Tax=Ferruginibacter sp. HRS2-29 TaxID=2487334 RepID=UPI0020CE93B1|nr:polyphosphate kinase 1 [Ferruginibacter sp. HRS2-29]MCP9749795.1 polyphosphate kinase 1 [Ferruginibacter sp. HRS2-29]